MPTASSDRGGFTLLELIIVVVLIGVLYGVFMNKLGQKSPQDATDTLTLKTLKSYLQNLPHTDLVEVVCTTPCDNCTLFINSKQQATTLELFKQMPTVYEMDRFGSLQMREYLPIFDKKGVMRDVCFRYQLFENGSSSHMVVKADDESYFVFNSFMLPTIKVASISEAEELFSNESMLPLEKRDYNF